MTNKAIAWVRQQKALMGDKPFFMYFAPGATHAPHQVPKDWIDRYRGRFDAGWDALRDEIFARQKALGVIPADAELTARPEEIPAFDDMPDELKPVLARQMEVYAAFLAHTDYHVGRLVDTIDDLGMLDDTLVYYIIGDNGASAEGTVNGSFNEMFIFNGAASLESAEFLASKIDQFGGPEAYNHYAVGWAHAMGTPYQWTKQVGVALGRHPQRHDRALAKRLHCPWRAAFTVLPRHRRRTHGARRRRSALTDVRQRCAADASSRHEHDLLVRRCRRRGAPRPPVLRDVREPWHLPPGMDRGHPPQHTVGHRAPMPAIDDDVWELYGPDDWTQAHNLAADNPAKLAELQRLFLIEATKYNVLPLDDRRIERFNADLAGRPQFITGKTQLLFGGMGRLSENSVLVTKNKSHAITANLTVPEDGAEGVIIAQGGAFAGWSLYAKDGRPKYCYNLLGLKRFIIESDQTLPPGDHQVRVEFDYDGGGLAKGATISLYIDGVKVGDGRLDATVPMVFSADETADVGRDTGTGVSDEY